MVKTREIAPDYGLVGQSARMAEVRRLIEKASRTRLPVLLLGESGSGKEVVARAIHDSNPNGHFVPIDCGALVGTLMESELFGHVKGAFTGAAENKKGLVEAADGGTAFFDEIGDLPLEMQVKLLRLVQEQEYRPVGSLHWRKVDLRIIAATHRDLKAEVAAARFRLDLYYRLNVLPIRLPPLRHRKDDIPLLIRHFIGGADLPIPDVLSLFESYDWPGNVRELENAIERAVVLSKSEDFTEELLPLGVRMFAMQRRTTQSSESIETLTRRLADQAVADYEMQEGKIYDLVVGQIEHSLIDRALAKCGGVKTKAADYLGINRNTLNKKVKDYGIESSE
jgi:DNA-binding NtrC family response regulator